MSRKFIATKLSDNPHEHKPIPFFCRYVGWQKPWLTIIKLDFNEPFKLDVLFS